MSQLVIRMQRHGCRHAPFYRIVVAPRTARRDGKFVELLGTFNPRLDRVGLKNVRLNVSRFRFYMANGAVPSDAVQRIASKFSLLPPPPLRIPLPIKEVKPELLPRPQFIKQPLPVDKIERY
eukprot:UN01203